MPTADGRVLQLSNSLQCCDHVLNEVLYTSVRVPRSHLLVEITHVLRKRLALVLHVLAVDVRPQRRAPVVDAGAREEDVIPERLQHGQLLATRLDLFVLGNDNLEDARRLLHGRHLVLHLAHYVVLVVDVHIRLFRVVEEGEAATELLSQLVLAHVEVRRLLANVGHLLGLKRRYHLLGEDGNLLRVKPLLRKSLKSEKTTEN